MHLKQYISRLQTNFLGFSTQRKIVVIESDDWGSIRMPSPEVYQKYLQAGYPVDRNPFERYDSIASEDDLGVLFNLLLSFTDIHGHHPVITANCVVANPDFEKIKENNFENYYYELITETFKRYPKHANNFEIWKKAQAEKLFFPQYHAREHLNVSKFMNALNNQDKDVLFGFENRMPGSIRKGQTRNGNYFVEATNFNSASDKDIKLQIYVDGLRIFSNLFGYKSKSVIPTNYIWASDFDRIIYLEGVRYLQGAGKMKSPSFEDYNYQHRVLGNLNEDGMINLVRNCGFEPTLSNVVDPVDYCLRDMSIAFAMNKPAIINTHRINYVGYIDVNNRDKNIMLLRKLLNEATKRWPDIEFMTTVELGDLISNLNK